MPDGSASFSRVVWGKSTGHPEHSGHIIRSFLCILVWISRTSKDVLDVRKNIYSTVFIMLHCIDVAQNR